jgi:methionyl-tRNA formyltransferase
MKYIFFGTPEFSATILRKLTAAGFIPQVLVCNPDRPAGRKKIVTPPPTKKLVMENALKGTEILQPENIDGNFAARLSSLAPDFFVVAAYAKIIPSGILKIPRLGAVGVHPSLLPKYRGSSPIQTAILNGEAKTGVTLYLLDEKIDHGAIIANHECQIRDNDNYETLSKKLAVMSGDLLIETLPRFVSGEIKPRPQNESEAGYTKKFTSEDGFVEYAHLAEAEKAAALQRKIRALNPEPGVWTIKNGKRIKLLEAALEDGRLKLKKIQEEGKRPKAA